MIKVSLYKQGKNGIGEYLIGGYAKNENCIRAEMDRLKQRARLYYGVLNIYFVIENTEN